MRRNWMIKYFDPMPLFSFYHSSRHTHLHIVHTRNRILISFINAALSSRFMIYFQYDAVLIHIFKVIQNFYNFLFAEMKIKMGTRMCCCSRIHYREAFNTRSEMNEIQRFHILNAWMVHAFEQHENEIKTITTSKVNVIVKFRSDFQ